MFGSSGCCSSCETVSNIVEGTLSDDDTGEETVQAPKADDDPGSSPKDDGIDGSERRGTASSVPEPLTPGVGVELTTDVALYDIAGDTADALRRDMNDKRPTSTQGRFDAHTSWYVSWRFQRAPTALGCRIEQVKVKLDVRYELPSWSPDNGAKAALVTKWNRYIEALKKHERGHALNGEAAAEEVKVALDRLGSSPTCEAAEAEANRIGRAITDKYSGKDGDLDRQTNHGKTQGAIFP